MSRIFRNRSGKSKRKGFGNILGMGALSVVLIAVFGILGVCYALWNQSFKISGSVSTGQISTIVRDVALESSDAYESLAFNAGREGNTVREAGLQVITGSSPFSFVLVFSVENNGTVPVFCEGIDSSVPGSLDTQFIEAPSRIEAGQTAQIKVRITKGYCENFEFSTLLKFSQAVGQD